MGHSEYDRIRNKNDKHINKEASEVLNELMSGDYDVEITLDKRIFFAKHETEIDILKKAKEMYPRRKSMKDVERRFGPYRRPTKDTIPKYEMIQKKTLELALMIEELCPFCREKSSALTLLQQAKMSANAAIAIYTEESDNE